MKIKLGPDGENILKMEESPRRKPSAVGWGVLEGEVRRRTKANTRKTAEGGVGQKLLIDWRMTGFCK